jgi:hypothetical protein
MEAKFINFKLIVGRTLLLFLMLGFAQLIARACDHRDGPILVGCFTFLRPPPGHSLNVNLGNALEIKGRENVPIDLLAKIQISDEKGVHVFAESAEVRIPWKKTSSVAFKAAQLAARSRSTVGPIRLTVEWRAVKSLMLRREFRSMLPISVQLIDGRTGVKTDLTLKPYHESPKRTISDRVTSADDDQRTIKLVAQESIALKPHEAVEVRFNPREIAIDKRVRWTAKVIDSRGHPIAQSEWVNAVGKYRTVRFARDDMKPTGEELTGAIQIQVTITIKVTRADARPNQFSAELVIFNSQGLEANRWKNVTFRMP